MLYTNVPRRLQKIWAEAAGGGYVRVVPFPTAAGAGDASYQVGFPPQTFVDEGAGGTPPDGRDFNGLGHDTTAWAQWQAAGGPIFYDATFATAIGGYPKYAVLQSTTVGTIWQSAVDSNMVDPDAGVSANWVKVTAAPLSTQYSFVHPNGAIEQWGNVAFSSVGEPVVPVDLTVSPYVPYSDGLYNVSCTPIINAATINKDTWLQLILGTITTNGFSVQYQRPGGTGTFGLDGFSWRTIGY